MITGICQSAADAAKKLAQLSTEKKNQILIEMADALRQQHDAILSANVSDINAARSAKLSDAMIDRLLLTPQRIEDMANGLCELATLPDPVGQIRRIETRPNGLVISKCRIPLGVICMIYESRPNVTVDAGGLCFKSGNAVILRGGKEAINSSMALAGVLQSVLESYDLPKSLISVVPNPDRSLLMELMSQTGLIDLIIPRGGEGLINFVSENSKVPVIQHFKGVCHLFVDRHADLAKAVSLLENGKLQRTGVCNALECLLVHRDVAEALLPKVASLFTEHNVTVHVCSNAHRYFDTAEVIEDSEFGQEYLGPEIAIRIVDDIEAAFAHIDQFGSHHTEVICTENIETATLFQRVVDASVVMVNASSRFSDGSQLGLGAEIGIATTKLHAYGPMGLESLTTEKFLVNGEGQIRE